MRNSVHWFVCVSACLCGTLLHAVERGGPPQAAATDHFSLGSARRQPATGTLRVLDPNTRIYAADHDQGMTKVCYKPDHLTCRQRQPGPTVKSTHLRFSTR